MIYFIILTYLIVLSISFDFLKVKGPKNFFYYFTLIVFILIAGLRWKVGGDTLTYQARFETMIHPITEISSINFLKIGWEPGYILLNSISKSIVDEFWFFQLLQAIFVNVIIFDFFKKNTPYFFTALVFYAFFYYFYFNMEILREIIPICIFIRWMYPALEKENYVKYYLINFILIFFHTSSLILFLFPLLSKLKFNRKGIVILFSLSIFIASIFTVFPSLLNFISLTDNLTGKINVYTQFSFNLIGMLFNFIIFGVFPYLIILLNKKYYKNISFSKLVYPYFFIISIYIVFSGFGRFINYLGPFMLIFYVNTFYLVMNVKFFKNLRLATILILMIGPFWLKFEYYSLSYDNIIKDSTKFNIYYPYGTIFNKEDFDANRYIIYSESMNQIRKDN